MGQSSSRPVPVIKLKGDNNPVYNVQAVREMLEKGPAKPDTKVFVICISGVYRSGKSFLLNLLKTYMDHCCKFKTRAGWHSTSYNVTGGNWAQGEETVTHGIWMYMFPMLINGKGMILMDCQGSKDVMKSSPTLDNLILLLGLQLSDVHILNVDRTIGADDLDRLGLCVLHADADSGESLFARQIFLIRNWENDGQPKQLDEMIAKTCSMPVKSAACGIKNAFKEVEVNALPHPGRGVAGKSEKNKITLDDVSQEFLAQADNLFWRLIITYPCNATLTSERFLEQFQFIAQRAVGKIRTPQEAYEESVIKRAFEECNNYFLTQVQRLRNRKESSMKTEVEHYYQRAVNMFKNNKRVKKCTKASLTADYLSYLEKTYKEALTLMESMITVDQLNAAVQRAQQVEAQAKNFATQLQHEKDQAALEVKRWQLACDHAKSEANLTVANEKLKAAKEVEKEKQRMRQKINRLEERAYKERVERVSERERQVEKVEGRMRNPSLGEATVMFGRSLVNNTVGKLFGFEL